MAEAPPLPFHSSSSESAESESAESESAASSSVEGGGMFATGGCESTSGGSVCGGGGGVQAAVRKVIASSNGYSPHFRTETGTVPFKRRLDDRRSRNRGAATRVLR